MSRITIVAQKSTPFGKLREITLNHPIRHGETTIKIEFSLLRERGPRLGREENRSKTLVFVGNATTIRILKSAKFYCREILLSLRRLPTAKLGHKLQLSYPKLRT